MWQIVLLLEGGPPPRHLQGPRVGSNTRKWIVRGDTRTDRAREFFGKVPEWRVAGEAKAGLAAMAGKPATWLSGFMVMGLPFWVVSGQSSCLAHIWSDSRSFLVTQTFLAKMYPSIRVSGRLAGHIMDWHLLLPFGPSQILSEAAFCSLSGPSVVRQLMQVVIIVPGQGRQLHEFHVLGEEIKRFSEYA